MAESPDRKSGTRHPIKRQLTANLGRLSKAASPPPSERTTWLDGNKLVQAQAPAEQQTGAASFQEILRQARMKNSSSKELNRKTAGEIDADDIKKEKDTEKPPWYLIKPDGDKIQAWDGLLTLALIFTGLFTPFEVGFLPPADRADDTTFIVNRIIDLIFLVDMVVQFFLMYPSEDKTSKTANETRLSKIADRYAHGWLPIDILSILPSALDFVPFFQSGQTKIASGATVPLAVQVIKTLRILRLLKMVRLLRASRILHRVRVRYGFHRQLSTFLKALLAAFFISHLAASLLGVSIQLFDTPLDSWAAVYGHCSPLTGAGTLHDDVGDEVRIAPDDVIYDDADYYDESKYPYGYVCVTPLMLYLQTLYWTLGVLMSYTLRPMDGPFPTHFSDVSRRMLLRVQAFTTCLQFFGCFAWAAIFGTILEMIINVDPSVRKYNDYLDMVGSFIKYHKIEPELATQIRVYFLEIKTELMTEARRETQAKLSPLLQEKVTWQINKDWIKKVPMFAYLIDVGYAQANMFSDDENKLGEVQANGPVFETKWSKVGFAEAKGAHFKWREANNGKPRDGHELINTALAEALMKKTEFTEAEWNTFGIEEDIRPDRSYFIKSGASLGLKWRAVNLLNSKNADHELKHKALATALFEKTDFTQAEWDDFGIKDLHPEHFVKSGASCFQPAGDSYFESTEAGDDLSNQKLAEALKVKLKLAEALKVKLKENLEELKSGMLLEFDEEEWKAVGVSDVKKNCYVKAGDSYFKPAPRTPNRWDFLVHVGKAGKSARTADMRVYECLVKIALACKAAVFVPGDRPPAHRLYVIQKGTIAYKSTFVHQGMSWGMEDLLSRNNDASRHQATAITYVHVDYLTADAFNEIGERNSVTSNPRPISHLNNIRSPWLHLHCTRAS